MYYCAVGVLPFICVIHEKGVLASNSSEGDSGGSSGSGKSDSFDVEMEVTKVDGMNDSNDHWKPGTDVYCKIAEEDGSPIWRRTNLEVPNPPCKSKVILKVEAAGKGGEPDTSTVYSDQYSNCLKKVDSKQSLTTA